MSKFNISYEELINILKFTNGFIAGGFALSAFLNNSIEKTINSNLLPEDQDIDIFIRIPYTYENNINCPTDIIFELGYLPFELLAKQYIKTILESKNYIEDILTDKRYNDYHKIKNKTSININEIEYKNSALTHFIKNITTYINNNTKKKIQIIILYDCKIENFLETFDLNICRLAFLYSYDKNDLDFYHNMNEYLKDYDLDMIINRKMYVYMLLYRPNIFSRIIKYINRGFEFIDKNNHSKIITTINEINIDYNESINKIQNYIYENFTYNVISYDKFCKIHNYLNTLD
jgi:hypothetical protein